MNDRYLFRGKTTSLGEWMHGAYITSLTEPHIMSDTKVAAVVPATVGQCTGLRDKNGVLIFEGDIVKVTQPSWPKVEIAHIRYRTENACFASWHRWRDYKENRQETPRILGNYGLKSNEEYEVIGNCWDDPELLEVPYG